MKLRSLWSILLLSGHLLAAQSFGSSETRTFLLHGTCGVFVQNEDNAAFVIDSAVIEETRDGRQIAAEPACKVWQPRPTMIAAVTGLLSVDFKGFKPTINTLHEAVMKLAPLKADASTDEVGAAMTDWGQEMLVKFRSCPNHPDGEFVSLVVSFRRSSTIYFYRERIICSNGRLLRDNDKFYRSALNPRGTALIYAGSCRSFINADGQRPRQPSAEEAKNLDAQAESMRSDIINSAPQLGEALLQYEKLLAKISSENKDKNTDPDPVGPPYQVLTLSAGSNEWHAQLSSPCPND